MKHISALPSCEDLAENFKYNFRSLNAEELNILFLNENCNQYKKGSILYNEGDASKGCYFLYSGIIKIVKTGIEGKGQIIRFAKEGELIGFRSLFSQERACTSAKVLHDSIVCYIPGSVLKSLIMLNPKFAIELIQFTCRELGAANNYITDIAQKTVRERLAEILIHLYDTFGNDIDANLNISLTRAEIANMVGTATETVIRLMSEFKADGFISLQGRKIKIINISKLKKIGGIY